ncbi:hypothetical protein ACERNI_00900 [Camelimonas sp. ID_303_24]
MDTVADNLAFKYHAPGVIVSPGRASSGGIGIMVVKVAHIPSFCGPA